MKKCNGEDLKPDPDLICYVEKGLGNTAFKDTAFGIVILLIIILVSLISGVWGR